MKTRSKSNRGLRFLLVTLVLLVGMFVYLLQATYKAQAPGMKIDFSELTRIAANGLITEATILDEDARIVGLRCVPQSGVQPPTSPPAGTVACNGSVVEFHADYPRSDVATRQLIDNIIQGGAPLEVDKQNTKAVGMLLLTFVFPLAMLANLFGLIFLSRGGDSSFSEIAGFGRLGRKQKRKSAPTESTTFADVAGADEAIVELREVIDYLADPGRFEAYNAAAPKGALLFGPPGCGKTLLARAVAGEAGVPFFSVSGTEFVESLVGVGAARVRDLFKQVREVAPAIVFIDELDALGRRREGEGVSGGEREQTLNQLLVEMDGFETSAGVVLMGATNRPDILDSALLRPGRFDRHITLTAPDVQGRKAILEVHARNKPIGPDVDFAALARRTPGFTGADLANVINEAALLAIRENQGGQISGHHISEAVQRVLHGPHRGSIMSPEERQRVAYHEAGHAVATAAFGRAGEITRISIVGRGRGLGQTNLSGASDRVLQTRDELEADLAIAMGGVAAEQLVFGMTSTAAEDDIERATDLAREMVGLYGMSPEIGRVKVMDKHAGYLKAEMSFDSLSDQTMQIFEAEVKRLVAGAEDSAQSVLRYYSSQLDHLASLLQEDETLEEAALTPLLRSIQPAADTFGGAAREGSDPRPPPPRAASKQRP